MEFVKQVPTRWCTVCPYSFVTMVINHIKHKLHAWFAGDSDHRGRADGTIAEKPQSSLGKMVPLICIVMKAKRQCQVVNLDHNEAQLAIMVTVEQ